MLLLSGCTTAAAGSTVTSTPTVGTTPSSVDAQRGTRRTGGRHPDRRRRHDPRDVPRTGSGRAVDRHRHARDGRSIAVRCSASASRRLASRSAGSPPRPCGWSSTWIDTIGTDARSRTSGWTDVCSTVGSWLGGYAVVDTYPPNVRYEDVFTAAQVEAQREDRGLWHACPARSRIGAIRRIPACASRRRPRIWIVRTSATATFQVLAPDPQNFDGDHNGIGCET